MIDYEEIPRELNLATYFLDRNVEEGRGDRVALYCGGDAAYTYREIAEQTNRFGNVLLELGVRREERVLLALGDGLDFVAAWFAVLKVGAVVGEVYTFLQPKDYEYYVGYSRARVVVVDASTRDLVTGASLLDVERDRERIDAASPELEAAPTTKDDPALWKFTTGSTGAPKAAVHLMHDPLVSFHGYALDVLGLTADDVVLPAPKLFFGYARDLTALFNFGVGGAGVAFPERTTPERLFALVARHRPTVLVQVPTMMAAMVNHADAQAQDLSCVRLVTSSGEALPAELHRRWLDTFGAEVLEGVGSSEAYHIYLSNRPGAVKPGSAGLLVPGYEARLDETGELYVSGESGAVMYWDDHARSKRTFQGDTIRTGDLFERDEDGYFWYRGRADDLIKVGGIWVAPLEIENTLLEHDAVAMCAVAGYEEDGLVLTRAWVVLRSPATAEELVLFARERLAGHKVPRDVRFVEDLPKTASGKIDRKALA